MAEVIIMPKLGFNMDEGQLVKWHKKVGDEVKKGEVLFEINTDKTTMPVEATSDGVILKVMLNEDEFAPVFTPIAVVGEAGENPEAALAQIGTDSAGNGTETYGENEKPEKIEEKQTEIKVDSRDLKLTPRAKKYIKENEIDINTLAVINGTGFRGGITQRDIAASPLARKVAALNGVDISTVNGSGVNGKVMKEDVMAAVKAPVSTDENKQVLAEVPYKGVRKIIGDRLAQSKFTSPHLYFTDTIDTTYLTEFRAMLNEKQDVKIAVSDLLTLAASKCLQKYPDINASLVEDKIVKYKSANVGTAVAGNNGLVVPVIKNTQNKTLNQIAVESKDLVSRAKEGKLDKYEYSYGTFTISNLGMFGIGNFTAIINPPEAAILSVSSVRKTTVVITNSQGEDEIAIRPMMNVQLTVDHRIIDGLMAAQFVRHFKFLLENPIQIVI